MDPSAATTSNSAIDADLASCYLQAMRLGPQDAGVLLQQQRRAALALAPPPSREQRDQHHGSTLRQEAPPSPRAAFQITMNQLMQGLQTARQFWPQTPPSSQSGSQHQSCPWSPAQQQPRTLSASASQYQPQGVVTASPYQYQPQQSVVTASPYQYQPQQAVLTASQYQYQTQQAVLTASQYQQPGDAPDYGISFHQRMRAIQAAQSQGMPLLRERQLPTLEETRSALLSGGAMRLNLVAFPESAANVVHLLENHAEGAEDYERILKSVLAGVTRRVHDIIDHREAHEVLVALLRACAGRHAEVAAIVKAAVARAPNGRASPSLLRLTKQDYCNRSTMQCWDARCRENCVKELMTAAAPFPDLRALLVDRLMCEGMLLHDRADELLDHCFATTQQEDTVIVVQCALDKFDHMIDKSCGCKCLVECYARGTGPQLAAFHDILIARAPQVATGKFSNYFMQHVLEHADGETKRLLVERLMADVVLLSLDPVGSYVVEACYHKAGQLHTVLAAFLRLDKACLFKLVQGMYSNYVVHKLLDTAIHRFGSETMVLARRIDALPMPHNLDKQRYAKKVMKVVHKLFARYGRMYC